MEDRRHQKSVEVDPNSSVMLDVESRWEVDEGAPYSQVDEFDAYNLIIYDPESSSNEEECFQETIDVDPSCISYDEESRWEGQYAQHVDEFDPYSLIQYDPGNSNGDDVCAQSHEVDPDCFVYDPNWHYEFDVDSMVLYDSESSSEEDQEGKLPVIRCSF